LRYPTQQEWQRKEALYIQIIHLYDSARYWGCPNKHENSVEMGAIGAQLPLPTPGPVKTMGFRGFSGPNGC